MSDENELHRAIGNMLLKAFDILRNGPARISKGLIDDWYDIIEPEGIEPKFILPAFQSHCRTCEFFPTPKQILDLAKKMQAKELPRRPIRARTDDDDGPLDEVSWQNYRQKLRLQNPGLFDDGPLFGFRIQPEDTQSIKSFLRGSQNEDGTPYNEGGD